MGFFDKLAGSSQNTSDNRSGIIDSGRTKSTGGHDHRSNRGDNRTPAQKEGDRSRRR